MEDFYQYDEEYRDTIATVDAEGKRIWVYPKKPSGTLHNYRVLVSIVLLAILFAGPFIKISGQPFLLLNIFERKFAIFGQAFWPQDFFIFALVLVTFFVFIILFTVVFGRVWCGWACPQTLFMEMVYRKIEYWIEGNANQQRKLDHSAWNFEKIWKKGLKHFLFISIASLIAHTVMAYLIGIEETIDIVTQSPSKHIAGFIGLLSFTLLFYWVFAYFREQACIAVCPYGRLQGVLLGLNSIVVAYDWLRGEPRGKLKKNELETGKGDCIDCKLCVHVCPTGIDIRNGTQLECVNCTACIDVCDDVMTKINKPKGLIRFASHTSIKEGLANIINARVIGYSAVLVALVSLLSYFILSRTDIEMTVLKVPGTLYQRTDDGHVTNLYNIQLVNKTFEDKHIELKLEDGSHGNISQVGMDKIIVPANDLYEGIFIVKIPGDKIVSTKNTITLEMYNDAVLIDEQDASFIGPVSQK